MQYSIGIYACEYLLLLELLYLLESELPTAKVELFGSEELLQNLPMETIEQVSSDLNGLLKADVAVLLGKMPDVAEFAGKFDGTIIDLSEGNVYEYDDAIHLADPLMALLYEIAAVNSSIHMNIGLPVAVYGREGVDLLMQETRAVYTFDQYDNKILPMRIAFNMQFYRDELPGGILKGSLDMLRKMCSVDLRIYPVSTVFVVDMFSSSPIALPDGIESFAPEGDISLENVMQDHKIAVLPSESGLTCTIIGDYLHLKTIIVLRAIKAALGVAEE